MKRNTLILLLLAAVIGVAVYFLEIKPGKPRDEKPDESKPAFDLKKDDIAAISITRSGEKVNIEDSGGKWMINQPLTAQANQSTVESLVSSLTSAKVERSLSPTAEEVKSYGLEDPAVTIDVKLKSGDTKTIKLGTKDFSGLSVYAQVGEAKDVSLVPATVLTNSDKSLNDLRDKTILGASQFDIKAMNLT